MEPPPDPSFLGKPQLYGGNVPSLPPPPSSVLQTGQQYLPQQQQQQQPTSNNDINQAIQQPKLPLKRRASADDHCHDDDGVMSVEPHSPASAETITLLPKPKRKKTTTTTSKAVAATSKKKKARGSNKDSNKKRGLLWTKIPKQNLVLTNNKDIQSASRLLDNRVELKYVLQHKAHVQWLAEHFWIFTLDQFKLYLGLAKAPEQQEQEFEGQRSLLKHRLAQSTLIENPNKNPNDDDSDMDRKPAANPMPKQPEASAEATRDASTVMHPPRHNLIQINPSQQAPTVEVTTAAEDTAASTSNDEQSPSADKIDAAQRLLKEWEQQTVEFLEGYVEDEFLKSSKPLFSLEVGGNIRLLIPKLVLQFLECVGCKHLWDFLAMKKTESSALVKIYVDWRSYCGLSELKEYVLARHLLGIENRIVKALGYPPVLEQDKRWLQTVLVILTGSAREFVIHECHITDPGYFVNERTKTWSDKLVKWRARKNMSVLKGSGKVAMISGWKTSLKESVECEYGTGQIVTLDDLRETVNESLDIAEPPAKADETTANEASKEAKEIPDAPESKSERGFLVDRIRSLIKEETKVEPSFKTPEEALRSKEFLRVVLKPDNIEFLNSVGIETAEQLISADKSNESWIITKLIDHRTAISGIEAQRESCIRLLYDWTKRAREKLVRQFQGQPKVALHRKRGPKPRTDILAAATTEADIFEVLSIASRNFLSSIGIDSCRKFLEHKTTILAKWYIAYRHETGMTELKGFGAIATISSWKAMVRKAATENGFVELGRTSVVGAAAGDSTATQATQPARLNVLSSKSNPSYVSHLNLLLGLQVHLFDVQDSEHRNIFYRFKLTVRMPFREEEETTKLPIVYITFVTAHEKEQLGTWTTSQDATSTERLPLLADSKIKANEESEITRYRSDKVVFSSTMEGGGLIDVGKYGFGRVMGNTTYPDLQQRIRRFLLIFGTDPDIDRETTQTSGNVFCRARSTGDGLLLYVNADKPLERGQTLPLSLSSFELPKHDHTHLLSLTKEAAGSLEERMWIAHAMSRLSAGYLKLVYDTISHIFQSVVKVLEEKSDKSDPSALWDGVMYEEVVKILTTKRRVHWLATRILNQLDEIDRRVALGKQQYPSGLSVSREAVVAFLLEVRHPENPKSPQVDNLLREEYKEEILTALSMAETLPHPFDCRLWCRASRDLLNEVLQLACSFVANRSGDGLDVELQQSLFNDFCQAVTNCTKRLLLATQGSLDDFAFMSLLSNTRLDSKVSPTDSSTDTKALEVVVETADVGRTIFQSLKDTVEKGDILNVGWYWHHQIINVVDGVAMSGYIRWRENQDSLPIYSRATLEDFVLKEFTDFTVEREKGSLGIARRIAILRGVDTKEIQPALDFVCDPIPNSLPFFLGTVWPSLRNLGWQVDIGDEPTNMIFIPPAHNLTRAKLAQQRNAKKRKQMERSRVSLESQVSRVGFGKSFSKFGKRLVVKVARRQGLGQSIKDTTAHYALMQFEDYLLQKKSGDGAAQGQVRTIVAILRVCLTQLIGKMKVDGKDLASISSETLLLMLSVLPSLLGEVGLSPSQSESAIGLVRDLLVFMIDQQNGIFSKDCYPTHEKYINQETEKEPVSILTKLKSSGPMQGVAQDAPSGTSSMDDATIAPDMRDDEDAGDTLTELVLPEDESLITEFASTVLRQFVRCVATADDKKRRKPVANGFPGILCRHCLSSAGEGKYFFTSLDSLQTASGVAWSHLLKCGAVPRDLRSEIKRKKDRHTAERKALPFGSQSVFYQALWKRLHTGKKVEAHLTALQQKRRDDMESNEQQDTLQAKGGEEPVVEFESHLQVMKFLQSDVQRNTVSNTVRRCIDDYYECIEDGANIHDSNLMTKNFSSEWILLEKTKRDVPIADQNLLKRQSSLGTI